MRQLTKRNKIRLNDVSAVAMKLGAHMPRGKQKDHLDEAAERLKASGWTVRRAEKVADEMDAAFTYTGLVPMPKGKRKQDRSRDIIVVKRSREFGEKTEKTGMLFTDKRGFAD
jgi:hypothetical protein